MRNIQRFIAYIAVVIALSAAPMAAQTLSLTTSGTGGAATYNSSTGVLNIPQYLNGSGVAAVPFQTFMATKNSGVTLDDGTPSYYTQINGNYFSINNNQNGLYGGAITINEQTHMIGDENSIINSYRVIRGGTATGSDEGTSLGAVAHNYVNSFFGGIGYLMYDGTVTNNATPVAYGPSVLTISTAFGTPAVASTMLFDMSAPASNTVTAISDYESSVPYTATVSTSVLPSTSATLSTDLCSYNSGTNQCDDFSSTQALNPAPVLTSFTVSASAALTAGEMCQFVDTNPNLAESTMIVSAPGTSGSQAVTAYLTLPHLNGTQMYCGDMVGYGLVFNADDHDGQLYGFHIYGAPTSTTLLIGDRTLGGQYGDGVFAAQPGDITIYPAATVISNINPSSGQPDPTYAQIVYPSSSFAAGDAVANPGFASDTTYYDNYAAYLDDPYNRAQGFTYNMNGLGFNWYTPLYRYSLGYLSPMKTPVDFMEFLGNDSVASGFSWPTQLTGSRTVPNLAGFNCVICFYGWDHAEGLLTTQMIFFALEGYSNLFFDDADYSLNYNHSFKAATLVDTSLGESSSPICTTTGGQLTNSGCSGGSGGATLPYPGLVYATSATGGTVATSSQISSALGATGLESLFSGTPYNINTASCGNGLLYQSGTGLFTCASQIHIEAGGSFLELNGVSMQFDDTADSDGAYISRNEFFLFNEAIGGNSIELFGDDDGSGTIHLWNPGSTGGPEDAIDLFGATGNGYFAGGITADGGIADTALGASTSPICTTTGGLLTNSGCSGGAVSAATSGTLDGVTIGAATPRPATFTTVTSSSYIGPVSAPSGSCPTNGAWVFSQDGHATFCASGTWVTKI